jgi:Tryptophan RNA-binding attenuator protein inhibitory protein
MADDHDPNLESPCSECNPGGEGKHPGRSPKEREGAEYRVCVACEGAGFFPTERGRALLEFLERHWRQ